MCGPFGELEDIANLVVQGAPCRIGAVLVDVAGTAVGEVGSWRGALDGIGCILGGGDYVYDAMVGSGGVGRTVCVKVSRSNDRGVGSWVKVTEAGPP